MVLWQSFFKLQDSCNCFKLCCHNIMTSMTLNKAISICISSETYNLCVKHWCTLDSAIWDAGLDGNQATKVGICHNQFHRIVSNHSNITCPCHISTTWFGEFQCLWTFKCHQYLPSSSINNISCYQKNKIYGWIVCV